MSIVSTAKEKVAEARERFPLLDHIVRMLQHYSNVNGSSWAGAVSFFGFLSVFPLLAVGFAVVGWIAGLYPDAREQLVAAIQAILPMVVEGKAGSGEVSIDAFSAGAGAAAGVGFFGLLYSGLSWISGLQTALEVVFETPKRQIPNMVVGLVKDLYSMVLIGLVLVASVALTGAVTWLSGEILGWLGLAQDLKPLLTVLGLLVGLAANSLLFFVIFKTLVAADTPTSSLWAGSLLGAIGFEVLKQAATYLIGSTKSTPGFAVLGIALVLLIWINYFSRVVLYAAAWAHTSVRAREMRAEGVAGTAAAPQGPQVGPAVAVPAGSAGSAGPVSGASASGASTLGSAKAGFAAGAGSMLALVALLKRRRT